MPSNGSRPGALAPVITKEEIQSLTPARQDAIVIAPVTDTKIGRDDVARFDSELGKVPRGQSG